MAASSVFDLDSSRLLTRDVGGVGSEQQVHHPPVEVDDQPHRPRGDEEQDDPGQEHTDVGRQTRLPARRCSRGPAAGRRRRTSPIPLPPVRGRCDAEERLDPDAQREPHAEEGERDLGDEVDHRPPGSPVAERRPQPPEEPGTGAERLGFGDLLAQHPPGERSLPAAEPPGGPQATGEDHDADKHDRERHSGEPQRTPGRAAATQARAELARKNPSSAQLRLRNGSLAIS